MTLQRLFFCIAAFFAGMAATAAALFLLVDLLVIPDYLPSYHQLLLENIPAPRIIIDSGSNSRHNIEPEIIEKELSVPTIVVADNINVPLEAKIFRIEKYVKAGDIVIFPLEWQAYTRDKYPSNFLDRIIEPGKWFDFSEYYYDFTFTEKIAFTLGRMNLNYIAAGLARRLTKPAAENLRGRFALLVTDREIGVRGDVKGDDSRGRVDYSESCHNIVWPGAALLPEVVGWAAARLAALQSGRGVKIVVTWPAVAGADCYNIEAEVVPFAAKIRSIFEAAGITVVGDPEKSAFSAGHTLDTYYHIDSDAARERTRVLVDDLKAAGLAPPPAKILPISTITDGAVERQELALAHTLRQLESGDFSPGKESFGSYFQLSSRGWYGTDDRGVWSRGGQSKIYLRAPEKNCTLRLTGFYARPNQPEPKIWLNGRRAETGSTGPIAIPQTGGIVEIALEHQPPKERGESENPRSLAFHLNQIHADCQT
jgi:hypothetical protein